MNTLPSALTVAGSDCSGGAGIQADLKTFTALGVYGQSCITAVTAQNTCGVTAVHSVPVDVLAAQLDAVFTDISPNAVKIGMLGSRAAVHTVAQAISTYTPQFIVLDPVMISTSGTRLLDQDAAAALQNTLLPRVSLITPNIPEAQALTGLSISGQDDMLLAAERLYADTGAAVLLKGGHLSGDMSDDLLFTGNTPLWLRAVRLQNPNTHGTGCTLSAAIAAFAARGDALPDAVRQAKDYLRDTLVWGLNLGKGNGPLCHMARLL